MDRKGGSRNREILIRAKVDFMFNRRRGEEIFGRWLQERSTRYSGILKKEEGGGSNGRRRRPKKIINEKNSYLFLMYVLLLAHQL